MNTTTEIAANVAWLCARQTEAYIAGNWAMGRALSREIEEQCQVYKLLYDGEARV